MTIADDLRRRRSYPRRFLSAPPAAAYAGCWLYVAWGSVVPITALTLGVALKLGYFVLQEHFILIVALSAGPFLAVAFGIRAGAVWAIKAFHILAYISLVAGIANLAAGVLASFGVLGFDEKTSRDTGNFICLCSTVLIAISIILIRKLRRVRWLDPYSTPEEWETPLNVKARTSMDEFLKSGRR